MKNYNSAFITVDGMEVVMWHDEKNNLYKISPRSLGGGVPQPPPTLGKWHKSYEKAVQAYSNVLASIFS